MEKLKNLDKKIPGEKNAILQGPSSTMVIQCKNCGVWQKPYKLCFMCGNDLEIGGNNATKTGHTTRCTRGGSPCNEPGVSYAYKISTARIHVLSL